MSNLVRSLFVPLSFLLFISLSDCVNMGQDLLDDDSDSDDTEVVEEPETTPTPTAIPERERSRYLPSPYLSPEPDSATGSSDEDDADSETGVSEANLETLLITRTDLPITWSNVEISEIPTELPGVDEVDGILVNSFFQQSDLGPYLGHMIHYSEDEADAEVAFELIYDELDDAAVLDGITDQVRTWQTAEADIEPYGDEAIAFAAIGDTGLVPVEANLVGVRSGQYISFIIHAELVEVDTDFTMEMVELALDRIDEYESQTTSTEAPSTGPELTSRLHWR